MALFGVRDEHSEYQNLLLCCLNRTTHLFLGAVAVHMAEVALHLQVHLSRRLLNGRFGGWECWGWRELRARRRGWGRREGRWRWERLAHSSAVTLLGARGVRVQHVHVGLHVCDGRLRWAWKTEARCCDAKCYRYGIR